MVATGLAALQQGQSLRLGQRTVSCPSLRRQARPHRPGLQATAVAQNGTETASPSAAAEAEEDDGPHIPGLTTQQVHTLLHVLCEETELAELELKMGSFEVKVRRSSAMANGSGRGQAQLQAPTMGSPFASTTSMDGAELPAPAPTSRSVDESTDDEDEGLIEIAATKVGIMRRSRYVKSKKVGKGPLIEPGAKVKKGQPIAFIEQLGTFVPVEATHAGEIASFLVDEGQSVEYKQPLVEMYPFFGGHIIGDRKNA